MEFRILGPVEVVGDDGAPLALPAAKLRALLVLLLVDRNVRAGSDELVDALWDDPPATATKTLQVYVSQLRKALGRDRIETDRGGYRLRADDDEVDAARFEILVDEGKWEEALALWRGPALADIRTESAACAAAADHLEELRLVALEERIAADLDRGAQAQLVPELEQLVTEHPWRERLWALLMLSLYRAERQAEALDAYHRARGRLAGELGLEPGRELRDLEQAILRQDPSLRRAVPPSAVERSHRRRPLLRVVALIGVLGLVVAATVELTHRGSGGGDSELRTFVVKVENVLEQAHDGRAAVTKAVSAAQRCALTPREAAGDIEDARANRQSLLQQLAALPVPDDDEARRAATLLQRAVAASFAADLRYRRDFLRAKRCPPPVDAAATARADRLKRRFVAAFNPLARRLGEREWKPAAF